MIEYLGVIIICGAQQQPGDLEEPCDLLYAIQQGSPKPSVPALLLHRTCLLCTCSTRFTNGPGNDSTVSCWAPQNSAFPFIDHSKACGIWQQTNILPHCRIGWNTWVATKGISIQPSPKRTVAAEMALPPGSNTGRGLLAAPRSLNRLGVSSSYTPGAGQLGLCRGMMATTRKPPKSCTTATQLSTCRYKAVHHRACVSSAAWESSRPQVGRLAAEVDQDVGAPSSIPTQKVAS